MYSDWDDELNNSDVEEECQDPDFSLNTPSVFTRYADLNFGVGESIIGTDGELERNISFTSQPSFTSQRSINFSPPNTNVKSPEASLNTNSQTATAVSLLVVEHDREIKQIKMDEETSRKAVLDSSVASKEPIKKRKIFRQDIRDKHTAKKKQEFTYEANTKIGLGFDWDQACSCFKVTSNGKTNQLQPPVGSLLVQIDDFEVQYLHREEAQKLLITSRKRRAKYTFILPTSPVINDSKTAKKRKREVIRKKQIEAHNAIEVKRDSKFRCPLCNITYKRNFILKRHYESKRHLKVLKMTNPKHGFCCVYCLKTFETENEWKAHKSTDEHLSRWSKLHINNKPQQTSLHPISDSPIKISDIKNKVLPPSEAPNPILYRCKWDTCAFSSYNFKKFCDHLFSHALSCREEKLCLQVQSIRTMKNMEVILRLTRL